MAKIKSLKPKAPRVGWVARCNKVVWVFATPQALKDNLVPIIEAHHARVFNWMDCDALDHFNPDTDEVQNFIVFGDGDFEVIIFIYKSLIYE